MLFLDTACNMIDKCCRFRYTKKLYSHEHAAECAFCFLIKFKNSRYFYIIKSQFLYLTEQQTKIQLVSSVYGLTAKLSHGLNLLDVDIPGIYPNGLTTATIKFSIVPRGRRCSSENNAGRT